MKKRWKILIGIVLGLVTCVAVVWLLGGRTLTKTARISIDAPAEQVFSYLTTPELIKEWIEGVTEMTPLTEGGHRVGAKSKVVVDSNGTGFEMTGEVVRSEPAKLLEVRLTSSMFDVTNTYELKTAGNQTHVQQTM